ncbi:putative transposase [Granulicella rosea]|uniref:Putative transposase n=1 Tax=Granulicella rosea TaxID=474952 RepID=A0A239DMQ7_9BACT|nr:putative transposase [Granulicella rosea]
MTSATYNRRRLFQVPANAEMLIETLQNYRKAGNFKLHAFVIMPDHIHLLLTPTEVALERVRGLIKGGFSHRIGSKMPVWQRGFTDHRIRDAEEFAVRRGYIHANPVRARLVERAEMYAYSSAYRPGSGTEAYRSG